MMKRYNNKGFTLVELLATITILGILSGIAIVSVSWILSSAKKNYYKSLRGTIVSSAKSYFGDHRALLPTGKNTSRIISIDYLVNSKYLNAVKDSSGKKDCEGKVRITRTSVDTYEYVVEDLTCGGQKIED